MGGMLHPYYQGEIDGHKDGLVSNLSKTELKYNFELEKFDISYWIGYGKGYIKGQILRNKLKKIGSRLSFEEMIECCQFLFFLKNRNCPINTQAHLDVTENWDNLKIDFIVCQTALKFLQENKLQRAISEISSFYKENFRLKPLKVIYMFYQDLNKIRN